MDGARSAYPFPLWFRFGRVITAAKRNARRRRVLLAAAVIVILLAGGAIGASLGLNSASHFTATRPLGSAFTKQDSTEAGGRPVQGLDRLTEVNFIPSARFAIGIVLTNEASQPVTLTNVRAVFPHDSVIRQRGTALVGLNQPPCTTPSCPAPPGGISQPRNYGALRPNPLQLAPGKAAGVQLNFRFLGCFQARHASLQNVSRIDVSYRDPAGAVIRQRVGLAYSTLQIDTPHPCSKQ
jgi:hypothetical protein